MRSAVIVCAGISTRYGRDKLFEPLDDSCVAYKSVQAFVGIADQIIVVGNLDNIDSLIDLFDTNVQYAIGGDTRVQSVMAGLTLATGDVVAIHDGARPYIDKDFVTLLYEQAEQQGSAVPYLCPTDTVYVDDTVVEKDRVKCVQTPQVFDRLKLQQALKGTQDSTDESQIWLHSYGEINFVQGLTKNIKITYRSDLDNRRVGYGYDIHRFAEGRQLVLGGVTVPYKFGLLGHSDADVVLHSVMDAMLSSVGLADIGHYFPDTDIQYKDIDSSILLNKVVDLLHSQGAYIINLSISIVAQSPRLAEYLPKMKSIIASIIGIDIQQVGISVTTAEGVGEIGDNQAIASRCVCLTRL
ncbi:MAG: 2-C-methyl-D-erythritol 2,4-cyclodiphosphate synthase [Clostridia bacterium]|nr:2-C-methyl-D-erythritol 2,4-cyclodiphosphate synthase [Clostridia bacterium]